MIHVFWSGGPASTATLYGLLQQGEPVHAHHVVIGAFAARAIAEHIAVMELGKRLSVHYLSDFSFSVSTVDFARESATFIKDERGFTLHRANVLEFARSTMGRENVRVGKALVMRKVYLSQAFKVDMVKALLPEILRDMTCYCSRPVIFKGEKGALDSFRNCGKCESCESS